MLPSPPQPQSLAHTHHSRRSVANHLATEVAQRDRELQRLQQQLAESRVRALNAAIVKRNRAPARPGLVAAQTQARAQAEAERAAQAAAQAAQAAREAREAQAEAERERARQAEIESQEAAVAEATEAAAAARRAASEQAQDQAALEAAFQTDGEEDAAYDTLLRDLFLRSDLDANGVLDADEFGWLVRSPTLGLALTQGQDAELMQALDTNLDGRLDETEFVAGFRQLAALLYAPNGGLSAEQDPLPWVVVVERKDGTRVRFRRGTGEIDVRLADASTRIPEGQRRMYQPPLDDFGRIALSAFLVADGRGSATLSCAQVARVLSTPELHLGLTPERVAELASDIPDEGIHYGPFAIMMRRCLAAVYLAGAAGETQW